MNHIAKPESATQARVLRLFEDELGYKYLGDWSERAGNSNIETDLLGNIDSVERANVRVRKKLGNNRITIQSIDHSSKYYSMPLDVFIDNCDKVTA